MPELDIMAGQLMDDVESVRELLARSPSERVVVRHYLAHLRGALRRVAVMTGPSSA
jgi:hypothetical protein